MYYFTLKMVNADSNQLIYERDLRLTVLAEIVARLAKKFSQRGIFRSNSLLITLLEPGYADPSGSHAHLDLAHIADIWTNAARTELPWLRVMWDESPLSDQPLDYFTLHFATILPTGEIEQPLSANIRLSFFDNWFASARTYLTSMGAWPTANGIQYQAILCRGESFPGKELFPIISKEVMAIGGAVETYDINTLTKRPPPRSGRAQPMNNSAKEDALLIFFKRKVFKELIQAAHDTPDREIGGVLVGQAHRNAESTKPFIVINGHIPAKAATGNEISLSFSYEDDFSKIMETQYKGRRTLGWYHTHPVHSPFLSPEDVAFHSRTWQAPWHVALVIGNAGRDTLIFHWNQHQLDPISTIYFY
ncbi:MAG: Mov34/MPN/PAD-1 family protein [Anaerolineales bacterium]|nr:Mov34/MPN/PAD-1 family protein [Anaerolineales bacterium]